MNGAYETIGCTFGVLGEGGCDHTAVVRGEVFDKLLEGRPGTALCSCHSDEHAQLLGVTRFPCGAKPTVAELADLPLRDLNGRLHTEAWLAVCALLLGDHDTAHKHATEAMRLDRAAREHVWRDGQDEDAAAELEVQ